MNKEGNTRSRFLEEEEESLMLLANSHLKLLKAMHVAGEGSEILY